MKVKSAIHGGHIKYEWKAQSYFKITKSEYDMVLSKKKKKMLWGKCIESVLYLILVVRFLIENLIYIV